MRGLTTLSIVVTVVLPLAQPIADDNSNKQGGERGVTRQAPSMPLKVGDMSTISGR